MKCLFKKYQSFRKISSIFSNFEDPDFFPLLFRIDLSKRNNPDSPIIHYTLSTVCEPRDHRTRIVTGRPSKSPPHTRTGSRHPFPRFIDRDPEFGFDLRRRKKEPHIRILAGFLVMVEVTCVSEPKSIVRAL